jgi:hypothetical protein
MWTDLLVTMECDFGPRNSGGAYDNINWWPKRRRESGGAFTHGIVAHLRRKGSGGVLTTWIYGVLAGVPTPR